MVKTEAWPWRNWISSDSPPLAWHSFAQVLLKYVAQGDRVEGDARRPERRTKQHFSVTPRPQADPCRLTALNVRPYATLAANIHRSTAFFTRSAWATSAVWEWMSGLRKS